MSKIIAFTGAGGTGKTTTANEISYNVPSMVDCIRKIIYGPDAKFGPMDNFEELYRFQDIILYAQFSNEKLIINNLGYSLLSDIIPIERSSIDFAAYLLQQSVNFNLDNDQVLKVKNYVETCINYANNNYDGIVYFPINKFTPSDIENSSKERDSKSIEETDKYINIILNSITIPIIRLRSTNLQSRVNGIKNFARRIKKNTGER